jgi:pyridoxal phosphate enzyme (YggS family)
MKDQQLSVHPQGQPFLKPTKNMEALCERIDRVRKLISTAEQRFGRLPGSVTLLAVSKSQPLEKLAQAIECGQRLFGESYLQQAEEKISKLSAAKPLEWHFIGSIQSNKTGRVAQFFSWVHSIDRYKIAARLNAQRPADLPPLNICLQVNISQESSKSGVIMKQLPELAEQVAALPRLKLRGLMAIPLATNDLRTQRRLFAELREALEALNDRGLAMDTLSMGMSNDLESAIAEGATIVRIGTAVFGSRLDSMKKTNLSI